jgi:hypothetical protein
MQTQIPVELALIISALAPPASPLKSMPYQGNTPKDHPNLETIKHLLTSQRITPFFYNKIKKKPDFRDYFPDSEIEQWAKEYRNNSLRNLLLDDETHKIANLFSKNGISTILLKGTELAKDLYQNIGIKVIADIDIMVKRADLAKCFELLTKRGYTSRQRVIPTGKYYIYRHHFVFFNSSKKICLELHWNIARSIFFGCTDEDVWRESLPLNPSNPSICKLNLEFTFILLLIQLMRDHFKSLKTFVDISWFIEKNGSKINHETLLQYLTKYDLLGACLFSCNLVQNYYPINLPIIKNFKKQTLHFGQKRAFRYFEKNHFNNPTNSHFLQHTFLLLLKDSWTSIFNYYRNCYLPSIDYIRGHSQTQSKVLLITYCFRYYLSIIKKIFSSN